MILFIVYENKQFSSNAGIANAFNDYFSTVGSKLSESIESNTDSQQFIHPGVPNSLFAIPVNVDEILK